MQESFPVIIVGAGQSGLAVAYHLKQAGISHLILESHDKVGDNWRSRWEGLRLFSPAKYDGLPGMPFPADAWHLPSKDEAANYLEAYAKHHSLPVRTDIQVLKSEQDESGFHLDTTQGDLHCQHLVVATGSFHTPFHPKVPGLPAELPQIHTARYRSHQDLPEGKILVVGAGASGQQVAGLIAPYREVILSGPKVPGLPRKILGMDIYWWLYKTGLMNLTIDSRQGKKIYAKNQVEGDLSIGEKPRRLKQMGVERVGRFLDWQGGEAVFDTCLKTQPGPEPAEHSKSIAGITGIVWATGYRNNFDWLGEGAVGEDGKPMHHRGVSSSIPGLYFIGIQFQYRVNSATMGGVGRDAEYLAERISARLNESVI